jgi:hypothetical protein
LMLLVGHLDPLLEAFHLFKEAHVLGRG